MTNAGDWDRLLMLWINHPAGRNGVLDKLVFDITDSSLLKGGIFLAFYWWLWFDRKGARRREVVVALIVLATLVGGDRQEFEQCPFGIGRVRQPACGVGEGDEVLENE